MAFPLGTHLRRKDGAKADGAVIAFDTPAFAWWAARVAALLHGQHLGDRRGVGVDQRPRSGRMGEQWPSSVRRSHAWARVFGANAAVAEAIPVQVPQRFAGTALSSGVPEVIDVQVLEIFALGDQ